MLPILLLAPGFIHRLTLPVVEGPWKTEAAFQYIRLHVSGSLAE
jgi:hypothetical protein